MTDPPSIFNFYSLDHFKRYHASQRAVQLFGHDQIIECIGLAGSHDTGASRDCNVDAFPIDGVSQQLIIIRSMQEPLILALTEEEVPMAPTIVTKRQ